MRGPVDWIRELPIQGRLAFELSQEVSPHIDERMIAMAERATNTPGSFFQPLGREALKLTNRPDSIKHNMTVLPPNAYDSSEIDRTLEYLPLLLGEDLEYTKKQFDEFTESVDMFQRMRPTSDRRGDKFLFVSNHPQLANLGYEAGLLHLSAREQGIDRLEDHLVIMVGRLVGYFTFDNENVMDGILRKVGSVYKTFPSTGSESMSEDLRVLELYRRICNHRTKQAFSELLESRDGKVICIAPSGEEDKYDSVNNELVMRSFGKGTCEMMIDASQAGVIIVPVCMDFDPSGSIVKFGEPIEPKTLVSIDDCHDVGQAIAGISTLERGKRLAKDPDNRRFNTPVVYR